MSEGFAARIRTFPGQFANETFLRRKGREAA
jgi:hypothetical protein